MQQIFTYLLRIDIIFRKDLFAMPQRLSNFLSCIIITCVLSFGNCCLAQSSPSSDIIFADLDDTGTELNYEESYPYFFQPEKIIVLSSIVNGLVNEIDALPQDYVKKDQKLLMLDSDLVKLEIKSLKDQIELSTTMAEAKIKLEFAEDNLKIVEDLYNRTIGNSRVGSAKERKEAIQSRDLSREAVKKAELEMRLLKNQLAQRLKTLDYYTISAPVDGVIVPFSNVKSLENAALKQIREGEVVQATQPVMAMMQVDKLRVRLQQSRSSLENIKIGQKALVHIQGFTKPQRATVVYIEPTIIEALDKFYIEVQIENPENQNDNDSKYPFTFRPGMRVRVELTK